MQRCKCKSAADLKLPGCTNKGVLMGVAHSQTVTGACLDADMGDRGPFKC